MITLHNPMFSVYQGSRFEHSMLKNGAFVHEYGVNLVYGQWPSDYTLANLCESSFRVDHAVGYISGHEILEVDGSFGCQKVVKVYLK